jgi:hypothetical protein
MMVRLSRSVRTLSGYRVKPIHRNAATIVLGFLAAAILPARPAGRAASPALSPFAQGILDVHNRERARLGSPLLRWNPTLEADATAYARQLASTGALAHASRAGRTGERENLSMGMRGWTAPQMMQNWIEEKRNFIPGIFPDISRTGQWSDVSHYSQMVWSTTTSIGCGQATGAQWEYLVCRYSPAGNIDGSPVLVRPCGPKRASAGLGSGVRAAALATRPLCSRG